MTDRNRKQLGETPDAVYVWVCRIRGSQRELAAFCDRDRARRWVRARLGSDGEWRCSDWRDVYDADGPDTGIVDFVIIEDGVALMHEE